MKIGIVGGGIVGLTTAYEILKNNQNITLKLFEKEKEICVHQSSRNSGVIHSGIYYKPNSEKAINCKKGYKLLIKFCEENSIKYEICGKLIVGFNDNDLTKLNKLKVNGEINGLRGLKIINSNSEIKKIEPECNAKYALHIPQTGIVNYSLVGEKLKEKIISKGGEFIFNSKVLEIKNLSEKVILNTIDEKYYFDYVITCMGLHADKLCKSVRKNFRIVPFKGKYYQLTNTKALNIKGQIYPIPDSNFPFLGIHISKTINKEVIIGPNAIVSFGYEGYNLKDFNIFEFISIIFYVGLLKMIFNHFKYSFKELTHNISKKYYLKEVQKYIGSINKCDLIKHRPGIRAQLMNNNGKLVDDFIIEKEGKIIHVLNAPSPAATSSFSIAKDVVDKLWVKE